VIVLFVDFTTPPPGGPAARLDLGAYFDPMLFETVYDPPEYADIPVTPPIALCTTSTRRLRSVRSKSAP